ncbi:MAG: sel1 repeat family protein [Campylobacteraceae bacterium]|nr:sel1 repeat family protein [Campylobacteraceae bacterium]
MSKKLLISIVCAILFMQGAVFAKAPKFDGRKIDSYQKECNMGAAQGCFFVGVAYFLGDGLAKNDAKAMEFFKKANKLDKNNAVYIATIARMYYHAHKINGGAALDDAVRLFDTACRLKDTQSCYELGEIYNYEIFDSSKAVSYYKQSCNLEKADGCLKLYNLKNK